MAGLWSRKFNHKDGEQRICKECGTSFHTMKPRCSCNACVNAKQKKYERLRRKQYERKLPYPYQIDNHNYNHRFYPLRAKLHKMKQREEWQEYFKIKLNEIMQDEALMKWINDRRDLETKNEKVARSKKVIQKDYPDTRGHYEY